MKNGVESAFSPRQSCFREVVMSLDAQAILTQNVEQITNFTMTENQWSADFFLDKKQVFHGLSDPSGYL